VWIHEPKLGVVITIESVCAEVALCKLLSILSQSALNILKFDGLHFIQFTVFTASSKSVSSAFGVITAIA
jgi:hypothetical protein